MTATAWPLAWPAGFPRTTSRSQSRFRTSLAGAVNNVRAELGRFAGDSGRKITDVVISSNVTLADQRPADPGVAVYYRWDGIDVCIPVDRYPSPEANLQAITLIIEAERTKLRHGGLHIVRAAMRGYAALPPPRGADGAITPPWWSELGFDAEPAIEEAERRYRELVKQHHPDRGGDPAAFNRLTAAIATARGDGG